MISIFVTICPNFAFFKHKLYLLFQFRVDKVANEWAGSVTIGAVGTLPSEPLPQCAMHLDPPAWLVSSDLLHNNGTFVSKYNTMAAQY